jgi:hypothetical protein
MEFVRFQKVGLTVHSGLILAAAGSKNKGQYYELPIGCCTLQPWRTKFTNISTVDFLLLPTGPAGLPAFSQQSVVACPLGDLLLLLLTVVLSSVKPAEIQSFTICDANNVAQKSTKDR